ncbi:hypothetical protein GJAV_G00093660 [Gymnothorax javanicus]|nr:hypothetical protein GJAV_G00093660 [Gymnothorax javanicus]
MKNSVAFQTRIASIMEALAKAAVAEISKLVEDGSVVLRSEVSRSHEEIDRLRWKLQQVESDLRTAQEAATRECRSVGLQVEDPLDAVGGSFKGGAEAAIVEPLDERKCKAQTHDTRPDFGFAVKEEQEGELVAQILHQAESEHNSGRLNNMGSEFVMLERENQLWRSFTQGDSDLSDNLDCSITVEQCSQSQSVVSPAQHTPGTMDMFGGSLSSLVKDDYVAYGGVVKEEAVSRSHEEIDRLRRKLQHVERELRAAQEAATRESRSVGLTFENQFEAPEGVFKGGADAATLEQVNEKKSKAQTLTARPDFGFAVKEEHEGELVAQILHQTESEHSSGRLNNVGSEFVMFERGHQLPSSVSQGHSVGTDDPVCANVTEQCSQSQSVLSPLQRTPATSEMSGSSLSSLEKDYHVFERGVVKEEAVSRSQKEIDRLRRKLQQVESELRTAQEAATRESRSVGVQVVDQFEGAGGVFKGDAGAAIVEQRSEKKCKAQRRDTRDDFGFAVKKEQEEESVAQILHQTESEHSEERLNNVDSEYVMFERGHQLWSSFTQGDSDMTADPVCISVKEQCSQSQSVLSPIQHTPATMEIPGSTLSSLDNDDHVVDGGVMKEEAVSRSQKEIDRLRRKLQQVESELRTAQEAATRESRSVGVQVVDQFEGAGGVFKGGAGAAIVEQLSEKKCKAQRRDTRDDFGFAVKKEQEEESVAQILHQTESEHSEERLNNVDSDIPQPPWRSLEALCHLWITMIMLSMEVL